MALRKFFNQLEIDRVSKLCLAAETDEKMFWRLLRDQLSFSHMSAFLVNGSLITKENDIRDMWADHFEASGTHTVNLNVDNKFSDLISTHVQNIFQNCTSDSTRALSGPLTYKEVAVSGVLLDYQHIRYAGPSLWRLLFHIYQQFFENSSICKSLKMGLILPLFKGKDAKANNKDNYRGITLFPTLCKGWKSLQ